MTPASLVHRQEHGRPVLFETPYQGVDDGGARLISQSGFTAGFEETGTPIEN